MSEQSETADSAQGALLEKGTNVGGYLVDAKIGEGGMGVVYGAHHPRIGKRVAIKVLARAYCGDPAVVARFEQEARFVNEIKHPNIVDVFQFGELEDKRSFFIMEWLEGEPLTSMIDRGPIAAAEAVEILDVICDALQAAHEAKVIHRDLKSDNVFLVTKRGKRTVKLLDFGLAKLAGRGVDGQPVGTTKSGILVGTPAYMSPEQARGKAVDGRTDIYALGILAYKMLTAQLPFRGDNAMDLIVQQLNAPPPNPLKLAPRTPPELAKLVVRMMAKDPDHRPSLDEIRTVFAGLGTGALAASASQPTLPTRKKPISTRFGDDRPEQDRTRKTKESKPLRAVKAEEDAPPPPRRRATGVLVGVAVVLVAAIGGGAYLLKKQGETPQPTAKQDDVKVTVTAEAIPAGSAVTAEAIPAGSAASSAASAGSAAQPETIEFGDDPMRGSDVGSGAGSAPHHHHHHAADSAGSDDPGDVAEEPAAPPPNKPGAILISLEHASTISIDGKVVAQSSQGGRFEVPPGHHDIKIDAADRAPITRSVDLDPGGNAVMRIADDKSTPTPPAPRPPDPTPPAPPPGSILP